MSDCSWSWAAVLVCDFNCQSSFYTLSLFNPKAKILFSVDTWHFCYFASLNLGEGIKNGKEWKAGVFGPITPNLSPLSFILKKMSRKRGGGGDACQNRTGQKCTAYELVRRQFFNTIKV